MSHNVESMMYAREKPWHGLGVRVEEAPTSADALRLAGLDWRVESKPVFTEAGVRIPGYQANTRDKDGSVLGIVSDHYAILQNTEAFEFTDALVGEGVRYETAGSLREGRQIWLLGRMPDRLIAGDKVEPFICFTNTHDGSGSVRACMTPIRVVCNNTLNAALRGAARSWSTPHKGNVKARIDEAKKTLQLADRYLVALDEEADRLANEKMSEGQITQVVSLLVPMPEKPTERQKRTVEAQRDGIVACVFSPDLARFLHTKWGFVNAVADYVGHAEPARHTRNFEENRWGQIMTGHRLFDKAVSLVS